MVMASEALKKYPFLIGADTYLVGLSLSNLDEFPRILELAENKIRFLLRLSKLPPNINDKKESVAVFTASLAMVSFTNNRRLIRSYGYALSRELEENLAMDSPKSYLTVASSLGMKAGYDGQRFDMALVDYLKLKGIDNDPALMLPQLPLKKGTIYLSPNVFRLMISRVFRWVVVEKMESQMAELRHAILSDRVKAAINSIMADFSKKKGLEVDVSSLSPVESLFPPCIKFWVAEMNKGVNIPHQARFLVATFLIALDMDVDEVLNYFKHTPDYDERIARYQIEDLAGERGSGKKYSVPRCDTLRTLGVCVCREGLCTHMSHPLLYYRISIEKKLKGDKNAGTDCAKSFS